MNQPSNTPTPTLDALRKELEQVKNELTLQNQFRHAANVRAMQYERERDERGARCAVALTGDPDDAESGKGKWDAIDEAIRLGQQRNNEANELRHERDDLANQLKIAREVRHNRDALYEKRLRTVIAERDEARAELNDRDEIIRTIIANSGLTEKEGSVIGMVHSITDLAKARCVEVDSLRSQLTASEAKVSALVEERKELNFRVAALILTNAQAEAKVKELEKERDFEAEKKQINYAAGVDFLPQLKTSEHSRAELVKLIESVPTCECQTASKWRAWFELRTTALTLHGQPTTASKI